MTLLVAVADASADRETILAWWTTDPAAMIGAPTGAASGIIAVDLDTDTAKGLDGPAAFAALVKSEGEPIRTRKHRTPRGGLHLLFVHPMKSHQKKKYKRIYQWMISKFLKMSPLNLMNV